MAMTRNQRRAAKRTQALREAIKLAQKQGLADRQAHLQKCKANGVTIPDDKQLSAKGLGNRGIYTGSWPSLGCSGAWKASKGERLKPDYIDGDKALSNVKARIAKRIEREAKNR